MLNLIEEVSRVHQGKRQARDGILGEQLVDVASDKIGPAEAAGLDGEAFGLKPFLKKRDLRGAAGAVHTFDDDETAGDFVGIETDKGFAEKGFRGLLFGLCRRGRLRSRLLRLLRLRRRHFLFVGLFWIGHFYSASAERG